MLINLLSDYSCLEPSQITDIVLKSPKQYKMYFIPKKGGGHRQIFHPSKTTKMLQYALIDLILSKIEVHKAAVAYQQKSAQIDINPIKFNALVHAPYHFSLHLDFSNFFPSITPDSFWTKVTDVELLQKMNDDDRTTFNRVIFINFRGDSFLSIGAPSSPVISNIFMRTFDRIISDYVSSAEIKGVYTRYADDIWISSNIKDSSKKAYEYLKNYITTNYNNLKLNDKKTYFCSIKGKRMITGLSATPEGNVVIPQVKKRYIRSLIYKYSLHSITEDEKKYLTGYISFIKDVEPDFLNSLLVKYGEKMNGLF